MNADAVTAVKMGLDMPRLTYPAHNEPFEQVITGDVLNLESGRRARFQSLRGCLGTLLIVALKL